MDLAGFSEQQRKALLDLLVLGMYSDGNLAAIEDTRIGEVLDALSFSSEDERKRFADASFTRVRQRSGSPEAVRSFVTEIAGNFSTPDLRRRTFNMLQSLLTSDNSVVDRERQLLSFVREEFKLRPPGGE